MTFAAMNADYPKPNNFLPSGQRILITGCRGLLGQKLVELLVPSNQVIGLDRAESSTRDAASFQFFQLDLTNRDLLTRTVSETRPNFMVNAAAMTDVDRCEIERESCWRINVLAVENLIRACKKVDAHLIHVSSDYVFDGKRPPYAEMDATSPLGFYGKSKLASENALRGAGIPYALVRTQVLYGLAPGIRPNFVTFILGKLREGGSIPVVDDQRGMPTLADDLARGIARIMQLRKEGIFHLAGRDALSRWEFAQRIARHFDADPERITAIKTAQLKQKSLRPEDSTFSLEKIQKELAFLPRGVDAGLSEFRRQWDDQLAAQGGESS
jgi:dTDP-4-dehydrorhamnose reductase